MNKIFIKLEKFPIFTKIIILTIIYLFLISISLSILLIIINIIVYLIMGETFLN